MHGSSRSISMELNQKVCYLHDHDWIINAKYCKKLKGLILKLSEYDLNYFPFFKYSSDLAPIKEREKWEINISFDTKFWLRFQWFQKTFLILISEFWGNACSKKNTRCTFFFQVFLLVFHFLMYKDNLIFI